MSRERDCSTRGNYSLLKKCLCKRNVPNTTVDKTTSKSYVQHLEFLDAKAIKRVGKNNTFPLISWTIEAENVSKARDYQGKRVNPPYRSSS